MAGERLLVSPSCRLSGPGRAPIWTEATLEMPRLSVWQWRRITARGNGSFPFPRGGVDPLLSGRRRPASAAPFLAAGHPPLSTGTVPLPSLGTRPKDWSTQKPPVCLNPPQTPGNSQRRDFAGERLTQRLVCPFFVCSCATGRGRSSTAAGQPRPQAAPPRTKTTTISAAVAIRAICELLARGTGNSSCQQEVVPLPTVSGISQAVDWTPGHRSLPARLTLPLYGAKRVLGMPVSAVAHCRSVFHNWRGLCERLARPVQRHR